MSIRIHNEALPGTSVSELSRSEQAAQAAKDGGKLNSVSNANSSSDSISLSSLSSSISDHLEQSNHINTGRIAHLSALYSAGKYNPDSAQISRAIVSNALGSSGVEG